MGKRRMCTPGQVYLSKPTLDKMWQRFSDLPERYRPRNGECVPKHQLGWMIKILHKDVELADVDTRRRTLARRYSKLLQILEKAIQERP